MSDDNTRDIAVTAKTMIEGHMTDCTQFRKDLKDNLAEFREDLKKLNLRMAMALGGLMVAGHLIDAIMAWMHK